MTATGSMSARPRRSPTAERVLAMKGVFTIGIDRRFADELAQGVLAEHGGDPLALADVLILVPTRRSVRALREAFLRAVRRQAARSCRAWRRWATSTTANGSCRRATTARSPCRPPSTRPSARRCWRSSSPPSRTTRAIPSRSRRRRRCKLARELGRPARRTGHRGRVASTGWPAWSTGNFAEPLAAHAHLPRHRRRAWPAMLAERGQIDAIERRTQAIRAQAARWRAQPPADAGDRRRLDRLAAGDARIAGGHRRPAAGRGRAARPRSRHGRGELGRSSIRRIRSSACANCWRRWAVERARRRRLARQPRRRSGAAHAGRRADAAGRDQRGLVAARPAVARARDARRLRHAAPGGGGDRAGAARGAERRRAAPPPWSRPTATWRAASRPSCRRWNIDIDDSAGTPLADTPPAALLRALVAAVDERLRAGRPAGAAEASALHAGPARAPTCSTPRGGSTASACAG